MIRSPSFPGWVAAALLDCGLDVGEDLLDRLVRAQLVEVVRQDQRGVIRYRFHDLLRVYARERLAEEPDLDRTAALGRLFGGYLALAEDASERLSVESLGSPRAGTAARWTRPDLDVDSGARDLPAQWFISEAPSLLIAVEHAYAEGQWEACWELAGALATHLELQSNWSDWRKTHELALDAARRADSPRGQALTLYRLGACRWYQNEWEAAAADFRDALAIFRELGDRLWHARGQRFLGVVLRDGGRWREALPMLEESLDAFQAVGDRQGMAHALRSVGVLYRDQGRSDDAQACLDGALAGYREIGDRQWEARTLRIIGILHLNERRFAAAVECFESALPVLGELRDRQWQARTLRDLASAQLLLGREDEGVTSLEESLTAFRDIGDERGAAYALLRLSEAHVHHTRVAESMACLEQALESFKTVSDLRGESATAEAIGDLHVRVNRPMAATTWYQHASSLSERLGDQPRTTALASKLDRARHGGDSDAAGDAGLG